MSRKKKEPESEPTSRDPLAQLEAELEVVKRFHLRAILEAGKNLPASISPELLKQIASYLKVVEKLIQIISLRKKEQSQLDESFVVKLVWETMMEEPAIRQLLSTQEIRKKLIREIKKKIKEAEAGQL